MPPAISLLRRTLEAVLDKQAFEVTLLFDFLRTISFHPSQQQLLNQFILKWESCLHNSSAKMLVLNYAGTWMPNCATRSEIRKQKSWTEFAKTYDSSFTQTDVDSQKSPDYQPINFKDLLRLSFWKEFYETFGEKIVAYIFEKCAIICEIDEGLHLLIANPRGPLYQKFKKYEGIRRKVSPTAATSKKVFKVPPIEYRHWNPFKLMESEGEDICPKEKIGNGNNSKIEKCSEEGRRLNSKKRKPTTSANSEGFAEPPVKKRKIAQVVVVDEKMNNEEKLLSESGPRWMKPKHQDLEKIIRYRSEMLSSSSCTSSSTTGSSINAPLNYVAIYKDQNFLPKDKGVVWKQNLSVSSANPKLPRQWEGLRLPNNVNELVGGQNQQFTITVYNISETLAKKLNIRLKPKPRCRRKKKAKENCESGSSETAERTILSNTSDLPSMIRSVKGLSEASVASHGCSNLDDDKFNPFSRSIKLPISRCLYNKSSWSKWPSKHTSSEAVSLFQQGNNMESISSLVSSILIKPVCSEAANKHLWNIISDRWTSALDESISLNSIMLGILQAHEKFKDMHKLQKNCIRYWQISYTKRHDEKVVKSTNPTCRTTDNNKEAEASNCAPELIDLTLSTPTTHFSSGPSVYEITPPNNVRSLDNDKHVHQGKRTMSPADAQNEDFSLTRNCTHRKQSTRKSNKVSPSRHFLARKSSGEYPDRINAFGSLKRPVPHNCVMQTLKQIFHIMHLDLLLGSKRNVRGFFKFVRKAIILGGTKSSLHLSEAMALIRSEETPFMQVCSGNLVATETFTAKIISWLFNDYILELLKMSFYITECGFTRLQLRFYLRESWTSASYKMRTRLCRTGALNPVTASDSNNRNAVIRFVPKSNHNLRSLTMMKKSALRLTQDDIKRFKLLLHYIDAKINKSRMYLPSGIMYEWRRFLTEWKSMEFPKLYFLRLDIRDAYPSVSTAKLKDILLEALRDRGKRVVQKQFALYKSNGRKLKRESVYDDACPGNWHSGIHARSCIVMDLERDKVLDVWKVLEDIINLITSACVVQVGKKTYEFKYGLPQGWSPSPILCSIYYGYIDSTLYKPYLESKGRLFLRVVDDYVFISPKATEVLNLINLMKIGCELHAIKINEDKTETNIFVKSNSLVPDCCCEKITYCGWDLCITCGHVSRNYSKYKNQDYCSTIAFQIPDSVTSPEEFIRLRGTLIMPTRLKPILLDPSINCNLRVILTLFEASILLGFRFYAICRVVYPSLNAVKEENRAKNLLCSIRLCCSRIARHVKNITENISSSLPTQDYLSRPCRYNCCGLGRVQEDIESQQLSCQDSIPMFGDTFRSKCLSYLSLKYVSFLGFRIKLLKHSEVFRTHILPEMNAEIFKLRKKLGAKHCDALIKIIGTKCPSHLDEILI